MERIRILLWLFRTNAIISLLNVGAGATVLPLVRKFFIQTKQLFTEDELLAITAIAQSSPGVIAINLAALVGHKVAGISGGIAACLGAITPPLGIILGVSLWYAEFCSNPTIAAGLRGMLAGVAALIVSFVVDFSRLIFKRKRPLLSLMIPVTFLASFVFHVHIALILCVCCVVSVLAVWWKTGWVGLK